MGSGQKICILMEAECIDLNPGGRVGVPVEISRANLEHRVDVDIN